MPAIHLLPADLVNRIAAGEVVERPASVVKELVENSLDAGATRIEVAVEDGGRRLISVTDDGAGMSPEDLALAFAPHATSKLAGDEDLLAISTMGFRGEALASIASICHARIRARRADDQTAYEVAASGEGIEPVRPCAAPAGACVAIRDLFYNTPARRKFLRTANTELGHITEQMTRLSLPHPGVAFVLTHNGRELQNLPNAASTLQRARDVFGEELAGSLMPLAGRGGRIEVQGLIAPPAAARATGAWQYFFLNGRYIRDRVLSHALREAYRGLTDPSRYPVAFIFIRMDPREVDVNVHPTKIEVRFRDSQAVHGELLAALKETLNKSPLSPSVPLGLEDDSPAQTDPAGQPGDELAERHRQSLRQALADFFKSGAPQGRAHSFEAAGPTGHAVVGAPPAVPLQGAPPSHAGSGGPEQGLSFPDHESALQTEPAAAPAFELRPPQPKSGYGPRSDLAPPVGLPPWPPDAGRDALAAPYRQAMQVHGSYIVVACRDGVEIIDQHALHERLLYNDLKRRLAEAGSGRLTSQRMLIPETLSVTPAEAAALEANADLLARLGIEVLPFGPQRDRRPSAVAVQQFPSLLAERGVVASEFVRDLLDMLADRETVEPEHLIEGVLEIMACKAAVKAGDPLTAGEIDSLLARREQAEKSSACPHGRPTSLKLTLKDLAKQFKRT